MKPTNSMWIQHLSRGIYRYGINYLLWMVWYAAHTSLGYLNTPLQYHHYRTPYTSQQSISHIISHIWASRDCLNIMMTSTSCLLGRNGPSCGSLLQSMCGMSSGKVTNTYTSTNDKCAYWKTVADCCIHISRCH